MTEDEQRREIARLDYENLQKDSFDRIKYQVDFAQAGFRGLTLINGGAIVALFTLLGRGMAGAVSVDVSGIWRSFACFVGGLVFTLLGVICAFASQHWYAASAAYQGWIAQADMVGSPRPDVDHVPPFKRGSIALVVAVVCVCVALAAFIAGAAFALEAVLPRH